VPQDQPTDRHAGQQADGRQLDGDASERACAAGIVTCLPMGGLAGGQGTLKPRDLAVQPNRWDDDDHD
jgi:hypothetical protein